MKRLLLLLCLPTLIQAQKSLGQDSISKVSVVISPALFVPVSVAAQGGIQCRISKRWSVLTEFAYPTFYPDNDYEKINYWRSGIEFKFHAPKSEIQGRYYSLQVNYLYRKLLEEDENIAHRKDGEYRYDMAEIRSPVLSLALKLGVELNAKKKRSFADVFLGMGVRRVFNKYTTKNLRLTSIDRAPDNFEWIFPDEGWRFDYPLTRFHFTAGLRFGFRL